MILCVTLNPCLDKTLTVPPWRPGDSVRGTAARGLFSDLIGLARARKVPVFLDTYGPALDAIWGFWPEAIQLNRREAAIHLRDPSPTEADMFDVLARWSRHGVTCAVVTDGPN